MEVKNLKGTREFILYALGHIRGCTLDLGAGKAKYKDIIKRSADEYIAFDMVVGDNVDVVGDINETGFSADFFDTVVCTQVFEHIPKPWMAAKEIHRILKSGGVCIVTAPFIQASHADPYDYFRYTPQGLSSLFEGREFEILDSGAYGKIASTLLDFIKMIWFSPYKKPVRGSWRFIRMLVGLGFWLDRFTSSEVVYGNSYIIAKKTIS